MPALLRTLSATALRSVAIALCFVLAGCPMTLNSDVRLGRLTDSRNVVNATIVYGAVAGGETSSVSLLRIDPAISHGRCGRTLAKAVGDTTRLTYFVLDVPPGTYVATFPNSQEISPGQATFIVTAGKQLYIGDFSDSPYLFTRDLEKARSAIGPTAAKLELAQMGEPAEAGLLGFVCLPPRL